MYDVEQDFRATGTILWKQRGHIQVGDTVFLYMAAPVSAIRYQCRVVEGDIPRPPHDGAGSCPYLMRLALQHRFREGQLSLAVLKEYGVTTVRGPRSVPEPLRHRIEEACMSHDTWNPWHGCRKYSEGCDHCYMYYLDNQRGKSGEEIYRVKTNFNKPLKKDRQGHFHIKSGESLRVCMTSDFFLEEADAWRDDVWNIMRQRPDVHFWLLTKRAYRIRACLPWDWLDGWDHVSLNVTVENQKRAEERLPILLNLPAKHKGRHGGPLFGKGGSIAVSGHRPTGNRIGRRRKLRRPAAPLL